MKAVMQHMYHERIEKPGTRVIDYVEINLRRWTSSHTTDYVEDLTIMVDGELITNQFRAMSFYEIEEPQMIRNAIATFDTAVAAHPNLKQGGEEEG